MRDLRIVIVPWNSESHIAKCLSSLPAACEGLTWEIIVVDNASTDKSVEIARKHVGAYGRVIVNKENRGFAKACNQGIAGFETRYVLLLNPDTECPPGSLTALVRAAEARPETGIVGPKLINADGTAQTSIRRFPGFWDQAGVMLKVHNVFPKLFRRYFAADWSLDEERDVDSVMGACFLIRRELLKDIGALDERYFIWFEEVDYCRTAKKNGWSVRYIPSVSVTHIGGQSFDQVFSLKKQRYFNNSLIAYFRKWQPAWQATILWMLQPKSLTLSWIVGKLGLGGRGAKAVLARRDDRQSATLDRGSVWKAMKQWALVLLALELISALTIFHPQANTLACIAVGIVMVIVAYRRPTLALSAIALELIIGSQGHLLQIGKGFISLRSMMFVAFFAGWGISYLRRGSFKTLWTLLRGRIEWALLMCVIVYAFIRGIVMGNAPIIADTNAWVFVALIIPVLDLATREGERLLKDILPTLILGPVWLAAQALGLEYLYAHSLAIVDPPSAIHLWVRRTGLGEVTPLGGNNFRIFIQSFIFALPPLFFWISKRFTTQAMELKKFRTTVTVGDLLAFAASVTFVLGLSRSMWLGAVAGLTVLIIIHLWKGRMRPVWAIIEALARFSVIFVLALALVSAVRLFPIPHMSWTSSPDAVASRATVSDPASNSRRALLDAMMSKINEHPILGSGFGATVTYKSSDPRVLALNPDGMYTTYAFEWGWLEHWIKMGIVGFALMILLVCHLGWRIWNTKAEDWMKYSMLASLIALCVTHVFTPYLNHPLGFGYLMMLEAWTIMAGTPSLLPSAATTE